MATIDNINAAKLNLSAELASLSQEMATIAASLAAGTLAGEPNYKIDGKSVSIADYRRFLSDRCQAITEQIKALNDLQQMEQPFEIQSVAL